MKDIQVVEEGYVRLVFVNNVPDELQKDFIDTFQRVLFQEDILEVVRAFAEITPFGYIVIPWTMPDGKGCIQVIRL